MRTPGPASGKKTCPDTCGQGHTAAVLLQGACIKDRRHGSRMLRVVDAVVCIGSSTVRGACSICSGRGHHGPGHLEESPVAMA